ncbi:MAG: hypothetical protein IKM38_07585 [Christensenellaceae bacterium]|nr:hypothetical protein [Christensenellaceae bacterium]
MEKRGFFLKFLAGFVAAVLLGGIAFALIHEAPTEKIEGEGYDTPEDAFMAYLTALQKTDREAIFETFAIESLVEKMSWDQDAAYVCQYYLRGELLTDIESEFTKDIMLEMRISNVNELLEIIYYRLSGTWNIPDGSMETDDPEAFIKEHFPDGMMEKKLRKMQIIGLYDYYDYFPNDFSSRESLEENYQKCMRGLGAEDYCWAVAEVEIAGKKYYQVIDQIKYDGRWYNLAFSFGFQPCETE